MARVGLQTAPQSIGGGIKVVDVAEVPRLVECKLKGLVEIPIQTLFGRNQPCKKKDKLDQYRGV